MSLLEDDTVTTEISTTDSPKPDVDRTAAIKQRIQSGEYSFSLKRGHSLVWDTFSKINDENGEELSETVACKTCHGIYKFTGSTSNLLKHKCYVIACQKRKKPNEVSVDQETKKQATKLVTEWSVKSCRSFEIIKDSGLKDFAKFLIEVGANYGSNVDIENLLPKSSTIYRNILNPAPVSKLRRRKPKL